MSRWDFLCGPTIPDVPASRRRHARHRHDRIRDGSKAIKTYFDMSEATVREKGYNRALLASPGYTLHLWGQHAVIITSSHISDTLAGRNRRQLWYSDRLSLGGCSRDLDVALLIAIVRRVARGSPGLEDRR
jgi:hypothetical protein